MPTLVNSQPKTFFCTHVLAVFMGLASCALPQSVHAYEDMATVSLGVGGSFLLAPDDPTGCCGPSLSALGALPVGRYFAIQVGLSSSFIPGPADLTSVGVFAELLARIDIIEWVPIFGVGLSSVATFSQVGGPAAEFGAHLLLGIDHLLSRAFLVGVDLRPRIVFAAAGNDGRLDPVQLSVLFRATWRFDLS